MRITIRNYIIVGSIIGVLFVTVGVFLFLRSGSNNTSNENQLDTE